MQVTFLSQPFVAGEQAGSVLCDLLLSGRYSSFTAVVAWAKASGLRRISEPLSEYRRAGGYASCFLGVDEGGASVEGLQLAVSLFDEVHVFHDPGSRTFHPKIYLFEEEACQAVIVGSSNLTRGGLYSNYEASVLVECDGASEDDGLFVTSVQGFIHHLANIGDSCRVLDDALLAALIAGNYGVKSERSRRDGNAGQGSGRDLFGSSVKNLLGAPTLPSGAPDDSADSDRSMTDPVVGELEAHEDGLPVSGVVGFWKELSQNDVSLTSSPGQMIVPIRFRSFFEPLTLQSGTLAGTQYERHMPLTFVDGEDVITVSDARAILYVPAPGHPRPNEELRFTFRDRAVLERLSRGDYLLFERANQGVVVTRFTAEQGSAHGLQGRFGPTAL
ncbi:MAG: hypothetical protein HGA39_05880 [Coriobacteriia bacterium]|nr:hypothetical protein [Coriobacteriia bacterium]